MHPLLKWMAAVAICLAMPVAAAESRQVYYSGPTSDHFDGRRFFNPDGEEGTGGASRESGGQLLRRLIDGPKGTWPKSVPVTPTKPDARISGQDMRVTWIGHSTVLVQTQDLNILTDPIWAQRASPVQFIGPKRVRQPGVRMRDLPKIDLILLSHNHYDHLDLAAMEHLWRRDRPMIVTGLGNDTLLTRRGVRSTAGDWDARIPVRPGIEVIVERAHHWSARWDDDHDSALWTGFTVVLPGGNLYFAGDTGPGDMSWVKEAAVRGPVRLAILPIGAFKPNLPPSGNHIDPAEAVTAFEQLNAAYALGVHWGTFELTPERINDPPEYLASALQQQDIASDRFRATVAGEPWTIPPLAEAGA